MNAETLTKALQGRWSGSSGEAKLNIILIPGGAA